MNLYNTSLNESLTQNVSSVTQPEEDEDDSRSPTQQARSFIKRVAIPCVLTFGAVGNAISLSKLAGRAGCCQTLGANGQTRANKLQSLERSALVGLSALAISDLLFCLVGIPAVLEALSGARDLLGTVLLYYRLYSVALHNLFLFSSTWIAVSVSSERFFAICFPLRARWYLKV